MKEVRLRSVYNKTPDEQQCVVKKKIYVEQLKATLQKNVLISLDRYVDQQT